VSPAMSCVGYLGHYRPERLPLPRHYYAGIFGAGTRRFRPSHKGWIQVSCCFHGRDRHPSLSVNVQTGAFQCFSCGVKGGSLIDFVMLRDTCDFKQAARRLGAWDDLATRAARLENEREWHERQRQRERIERAQIALAQMEHALRTECRDRIHGCDRVLSTPGPWDEAQRGRAHAACVLRDEYLLPQYTLLSFAAMAERSRYILADRDVRAATLFAVRLAGGIRTDDGRWIEVLQ